MSSEAQRWFRALPRPVVALDAQSRVSGANVAAEALFELGEAELVGAHFAETLLPEASWGGFAEIRSQVLLGAPWSGQLKIRPGGPASDRTQTVQITVVPVRDEASEPGLLFTVDAVGERSDRDGQLYERFSRLAHVAAELQGASDIKALADVVVTHFADAARATTAALVERVAEDTLALVGLRGGTPGSASRWATFPIDESTPTGVAVLTGRAVLVAGRDEILRRFPGLEILPGERTLLALPLVIDERVIGVVNLSYPSRLTMDDSELHSYQVVADTCAQALARVRALETVADQNEKLQFLAAASAELAASLDYEATLRSVAWMSVPGIADWCSIQLAQDGVLRVLAVAHKDPEMIALAEELTRRYPTDPESSSGAYAVLRTGESLLMAEIPDEVLVGAAADAEHLRILRALELRSALTVPLKTRDRILGVISWVTGGEGKRFSAADVPFAEDFARRAATAIDNAQLHSELREIADQLQEAVLPPQLPEVAGWLLASSYSSAGRVEVGGDFYDVIPLRDGRLAFVVGDVMGRGVDAAASMAQIRAALRAFVAVDPQPVEVLRRLDLLYEQFPSDQLVTLIYALAEPDAGRMSLVSAGHPPPLLRAADGTWSFVDAVRGTILGVGPSERLSAEIDFGPGDSLLVYTDGLLERRGEDLDRGMRRLRDEAQSLSGELAGPDLAALAERLRDPSRDDDAAVLAVTRTSADPAR